jgi:hypothetical protein
MTMVNRTFALAPMSRLFRAMTLMVLALPIVFFVIAAFGIRTLVIPAAALVILYAWVWLRFRPSRFIVHENSLEVIWPLKRRQLPRKDIGRVRHVDMATLRAETGWVARVGVGGLWGTFGWLWTERKGIVQIYVTRSDGFVWLDRKDARPWLITPERPDAFVRALESQTEG